MTGLTVDRVRNYRITVRCRRETFTRWRVQLADTLLDGESYLNTLMDNWRLNHPGTMRALPGRTFGGQSR